MSTISPPIAVVTPTDHGGLILIANGFGLCLILIFMIIRVVARLFISPPFDRDDLALGVATVSLHEMGSRKSQADGFAGVGDRVFGACLLPCLSRIWQNGTTNSFDEPSLGTEGMSRSQKTACAESLTK
jgi:hypothetical protein